MSERLIIDGHIHCGPRKFQINGMDLSNPIDYLVKNLEEINVRGAVLIPFAEDIYRKPYASRETAKKAHDYILEIARKSDYFYPFYFVWNDFVVPENLAEFKGIKWHRHGYDGFLPGEPEYDYSDPKCDKFVEAVRKYNLPIIFEESFDNTKLFCNKYPDLKVIIPHIGTSNDRVGGGRRVISEFKDYPNVYLGTSVTFPFKIASTIFEYGADRVIFGSDAPYSSTKIELAKLLEYDLIKYLSEEDMEKILAKNILRLMNISS